VPALLTSLISTVVGLAMARYPRGSFSWRGRYEPIQPCQGGLLAGAPFSLRECRAGPR
jgi:hypothetical protein